MRTYKQLTSEQRYQISALKRMGHCPTEITKELEVHKSTISRELSRNAGERGYRPKQAVEKASQRRVNAPRQERILKETWKVVEEKLCQDWSPEQISGWLEKSQVVRISHEWIYQYILTDKQIGGNLYTHLRQHGKRRKRYGKYDRRGKLPNRVSIEERPQLVEQRERLGDWEIDTLVSKGHQGALVSLVERKSRYTLLQPVAQRLANVVADATISLLNPFAGFVHTITGDNGKEFAEHLRIAETLKTNFYFAHPYSAWERGTNENTNGLVRQYFPKKTDFSKVALSETTIVVDRLNHRPRKCLDFKTPFEVFFHRPVALDT
ncbi:MAG: IS30 family transposase [Anaerolineales bacterium]|nr:IS30 family transposase [Anaerolineales bacterium]